jgi:hypothetical protein
MDFLNSFSKNTQIPKLLNIRLMVAELFNADRRTGVHDKTNGPFSQFCERA